MVKFRAVFVIMVSVGPGIGIGHGVNARTMLKFRSRIVGSKEELPCVLHVCLHIKRGHQISL